MFRKKHPNCPRCKNNISKNYEFCPYCGYQLKDSNDMDAWGMLGTDDIINKPRQSNNNLNPFENSFLGGGILNKMLGSAMKMLEKEMQREMKNIKQGNNTEKSSFHPKTNLQIYINGKKVNLGKAIKKPSRKGISEKSGKSSKTRKNKKVKEIKIPKKELKGFSKLSKQEPETNIRRLSDRIIYEIHMPGVKSKKDISITKLENSIEIKAISKARGKKKAYHKIIRVPLPIVSYSLNKEILILELATK